MIGTTVCQVYAIPATEHWWTCRDCQATWNERNTGPHWRPILCPDREGEMNGMAHQAYRQRDDNDDGA
jgi:hypothetical protein